MPHAVYYGPGSQESLVIEAHPQQQMQMQVHGSGTTEKTEGKLRYSRSASVRSGMMGKSMEEQGMAKHGKFETPPPLSPRSGSPPQDRVAKKKCKGLSIFCFFIKR